MKEKKYIDRIFKEKFKDFESEPHQENWDKISSRLDQKNHHTPIAIPLWLKIGSVAAIIVFIISVLQFNDTQNATSSEPRIVIEETEELNNTKRTQDSLNKEQQLTKPLIIPTVQNRLTNTEISNSQSRDSSRFTSAYAKHNNLSKKLKSNHNYSLEKSNKISSITKSTQDNAIAKERISDNNKIDILPFAGIEHITPITTIQPNITTIDSLDIKDSILKHSEEKNALAQIEDQKTLEIKKDVSNTDLNDKKLRISSFAAPVFYSNIGSGNELSNQFSENTTTSETTLSYGIKVAYDVGEKLKLRTGVNKVNMSYHIKDIAYSPSAVSSDFKNISSMMNNLEIRNDANSRGDNFPSNGYDENSPGTSLTAMVFTPGKINQQFGFIEIPMELEYELINKKIGLSIIGGGSSLFLDNNSLDLIAGDSRTTLGKASNINTISFSTNIGLGIDYELSETFSVSVEPILKYHLNTFTEVNNVKPVNFGIYSGLNFKF